MIGIVAAATPPIHHYNSRMPQLPQRMQPRPRNKDVVQTPIRGTISSMESATTRVLIAALLLNLGSLAVGQEKEERTIERSSVLSARIRETADLKRVSFDRLKIESLSDSPLTDWEITDLDGRNAEAELKPKIVEGNLTISPSTLAQFAIKPKAVETKVLDRPTLLELPGGIISTRPGTVGSTKAGWFRLTFLASPLPAIWNPLSERYETDVTFGLKPPSDDQNTSELKKPVDVKVGFEGLVADPAPEIRIGGVGLNQEKSFRLAFLPTTENPVLKVRSTISDVDLELRAMPRLQLKSRQSEMLGFGLEQVTFDLSEVLPHGDIAERDSPLPISVSVTGRAVVYPDQLVLEPQDAQTQFRVRSTGIGPLQVTARSGDSVSTGTIQQTLPIGPLLAVLAGGALGGFSRRFIKGASKKNTTRWIIEGLAISVIAFVAGVLGVGYLMLPSAIVATEAGAFLSGAICGFAGVTVLEKLTSKVSNS